MNNERFLVFDIDDTLYSQMEPLLTACEFSLGRKLPDPELFYRIFGKRSAEMFLFSESGQVSIHESRIYRIENKENQSHLHVSGVMTQLLDECEAAGVKMGVITNGPFSHQVQKFHTLGLDKWFTEDQLIVSVGVGVAKPDVQIFRMAEEKWGMKPENTFMIGDSLENDIAGAKNAGWKTIWMNHHRYTVPEGMEKPDYIAYTEEELRKLIVQICFTTKKDG